MLAELRRRRRLRSAYLERKREELLLSAVVQIALDPPPGRIGGGDDPRARGFELAAALGVRDRCAQELRELREPGLGFLG